MVALIYTASDREIAGRIQFDLEKLGYTFNAPSAETQVLVFAHSPEAIEDAQLQSQIMDALDKEIHLIPVIIKPAPLPGIISNLEEVDFTQDYRLNTLRKQIDYLLSDEAPRPMKVLTPAQRARNRRLGLLFGIPAILIFLIALYAVGVLGLQRPADEVDLLETARVEMRNEIINPTIELFLPQNEEEAAAFIETVPAIPTRLRPFAIETATALAEPSITPTPEP